MSLQKNGVRGCSSVVDEIVRLVRDKDRAQVCVLADWETVRYAPSERVLSLIFSLASAHRSDRRVDRSQRLLCAGADVHRLEHVVNIFTSR